MTRVRRSLIGLLVAGLVTALVYVLIINGLQNPVGSTMVGYQATFNDVSGLRMGADVRRKGVQVGKVTAIAVSRSGDGNVAVVQLELATGQLVTTATHLSVRFQNLTGARYIDIRDDPTPDPQPIRRIPVEQTTGSFDITTIFHGLEPVLRTLDPADVNDLADKLAVFLDGDGAGAADLLNSIRTLAAKVSDRRGVISALVDNIAVFATKLKGHSDALMQNIALFQKLIEKLVIVQKDFGSLAEYGPTFLTAVNRLLWLLGLRPGAVLNQRFDVLRANLYRIPEFFERMPGAYSGLQPFLKNPGSDLHCPNGHFMLPPMVKVFIGDDPVILCNRS